MKISFQIPESWNKLNDHQILKVASLISSGVTGVLFDIRVLFILTDVKWFEFRRLFKLKKLVSLVSLTSLKNHYQFIYKDKGPTRFVNSVCINGINYYPPIEKLHNLTIEEFAVADDLYLRFKNSGDIKYLAYLASVLYVKDDALVRPLFNKNELNIKGEIFKSLPLSKLLAIQLCYQGCRSVLETRFRYVFPKTKTNSKLKTSSSSYGLGKVILEMAGKKFGDHESTKRTNVWTFLEQLNSDNKERKNGKSSKS